MIGILDITIQAHSPNFPLSPIYTFTNSAQSFRLRGVPKQIGDWKIESVAITLTYPDSTTVHAACVREGNIWIGTVAGCPTSGSSTNGFVVTASGTDENGNPVSNYTLGAGDIYVMELDGSVSPTDDGTRMFYYGSVPTTPKKGDVCYFNDTMNVYDGTQWKPAAKLADYATKTELESSIAEVASDIPTKTSDLTNDSDFTTNTALENYLPLSGDATADVVTRSLTADARLITGDPNVNNTIGPDEGGSHYGGVLIYDGCVDIQNTKATSTIKWYGTRIDAFGEITIKEKNANQDVIEYDRLKLPKTNTQAYSRTIATQEWVLEQLANLKAELQS